MKRGRGLALLAATVLLAGCGGGGSSDTTAEGPALPPEPRAIEVSLNGFEGPEHAGFLMARENGYFEDVGLEVATGSPANPSRPVRYVLSETSDLGVSHLPQVAISIAKGKPIVAVASVIAQPTATMIWLPKSGIESISDLKGKTVAIPGLPFQKAFLQNVLARAGLALSDVELKLVSYKSVPVLTSGKADAIFGGSNNVEGAELRALGLKPIVTPVEELGIPPYDELVLFASRERVAKEPQLIRDLLEALSRGTAAAKRDPRRAVEVIENGVEPNPDSTRKGIGLGVEATLPLLSESGEMNPAQAEALIDWMHSEGMIKKKIPVSALLTNEFLPQP
ncbi:MAG TPA: ABC transporter substrate-binding protein [Solirubrobacterales bacterium]|nr:ABC transporter substrate-binding protein [Solirubrobacterales bacterium]